MSNQNYKQFLLAMHEHYTTRNHLSVLFIVKSESWGRLRTWRGWNRLSSGRAFSSLFFPGTWGAMDWDPRVSSSAIQLSSVLAFSFAHHWLSSLAYMLKLYQEGVLAVALFLAWLYTACINVDPTVYIRLLRAGQKKYFDSSSVSPLLLHTNWIL